MTAARTVDPIGTPAGRVGQLAYGAGVAGLGVLCLRAGDLAQVFQPVPRWMPLRAGLAYACGAILLAGGLALLTRTPWRAAALAVAAIFSLWLVVLGIPAVIAKPGLVGAWEGCGLNMAVIAGGWILLARSDRSPAGLAAGCSVTAGSHSRVGSTPRGCRWSASPTS